MVSSVRHKSISFSRTFCSLFTSLPRFLFFATLLSLCQCSLALAGWWGAIRATKREREREKACVCEPSSDRHSKWTNEQASKRASPIIKHVLDLRFYNTNRMTQPPYSVHFIHRLVYPEHFFLPRHSFYRYAWQFERENVCISCWAAAAPPPCTVQTPMLCEIWNMVNCKQNMTLPLIYNL